MIEVTLGRTRILSTREQYFHLLISYVLLELFWHVLYTKSRQEKALAEDLSEMGVEHYLPLIKDFRYHGSRRVCVSTPLFAGYMFIQSSVEQLFESLRTRRVVRVILVADQDQTRLGASEYSLGARE